MAETLTPASAGSEGVRFQTERDGYGYGDGYGDGYGYGYGYGYGDGW